MAIFRRIKGMARVIVEFANGITLPTDLMDGQSTEIDLAVQLQNPEQEIDLNA